MFVIVPNCADDRAGHKRRKPLKQKPTRAYGRVFYFGRGPEETRRRALSRSQIGNIEPEWDDLLSAEDEIASPAAFAVPSREG